MTAWRDLDDVRQPLPLDDWTADRLLAGMVDPDDAPPGYAGLVRALAQTRGPVEAGELSGRELLVAAVTAAVADASPPTVISTPSRRRPMLYRLLGTKVAAATMTTVLLATGAAAAAGSLPGPAQDAVSDVADAVGVTLPDSASDTAEQHVADEAERQARKAAHQADLVEQKALRDAAKTLRPAEDDGTGQDATDEVTGAGHGIGKGTPASDQGKAAHVTRDDHLKAVAEGQAGHDDADAGDDNQVDEGKDTPVSEQGQAGQARRDEHLGVIADQKAERDAQKAERPQDGTDDGDDADDPADDADDDGADEGDQGKDHEHDDDEHEGDDEAEDAPAAS
jgi:hypothetical protein